MPSSCLPAPNCSRIRSPGVFLAEYEQGDVGDVLFRVASKMGLEGIVSEHLDRTYGLAGADTPAASSLEQD
jgi:hypothetical protein